MKYIIEQIIQNIVGYSPSQTDEVMVRIDGFEDIEIYKSVAERITSMYGGSDLNVVVRIAKNKWEYFKNNSNTTLLQQMESSGWIIKNESVTEYRNRHDSNILILMGTEEEEDQDGLSNFATITSATLASQLGKKYSKVFTTISKTFSDQDLECIEKLYAELFRYVPVDIVKYSDMADEWEPQIFDLEDLIRLFFETLPTWGIPKTVAKVPKKTEILSKKGFLKPAYDFITRLKFKKTSGRAYKKYCKQIEKYGDSDKAFSKTWPGWSSQSCKSYDEFAECLKDFIAGKGIESAKNKLLHTDYSIIADVFGYKIENEKPPKPIDTTIVVKGEPIRAVSEILLNCLGKLFKGMTDFPQYVDITRIEFEVVEAAVNSNYSKIDSDDALEDVKSHWNVIARSVNSLLEFINSGDWTIASNSISVVEKPENIFNPMKSNIFVENELIKIGSALNKITFKISCFAGDTEVDTDLPEYLWQFNEDAAWLFEYGDIELMPTLNPDSSFIPLVSAKHLRSMILSKSAEEFFNLYGDIDFNYSYDFVKETENSEFADAFNSLGKRFAEYIIAVRDNGFYSAIVNGKLDAFVKQYVDTGKLLTSSAITDEDAWVQMAYIYAFTISENPNALKCDEETECCVTPAWHPATLQKLNAQKVFFLNGMNSYWEQVLAGKEKYSDLSAQKCLDELLELSNIKSSVNLFPYDQSCYGVVNTFGAFSIYAKSDVKKESRIKDIIKKDAVFDEDFKSGAFKVMTDDAVMIYDVLQDYTKTFRGIYRNFNLVFINPSDLQPIVAAIYNYTEGLKNTEGVNITLKIFVKPENKGGRNYLAYWMDQFFAEDEKINVKAYLNIWSSKSDLDRLLDGNNDIIFTMDLLHNANPTLMRCSYEDPEKIGVKFPITYKPSPLSKTSVKRRIELTQPQFEAEVVHTQVVKHIGEPSEPLDKTYMAIKEIKIDNDALDIIYSLHMKAFWVVCIDSGMDGALLRSDSKHKDAYSIIGFSTGKGACGQYNLTITSRRSIIMTLKKQFAMRLKALFHWDDAKIEAAAERCIREACSLDGISLLSAINQYSTNVHEFMAYVLTSLRENQIEGKTILKTIIHLDSYKHWFTENKTEEDGASRPDFLIIEIVDTGAGKLKLKATIAECKIATEANAQARKADAYEQMKNGLSILSKIFDPDSTSIKRRYWFAQLYRALTFAQVTFKDTDSDFQVVTEQLRKILNGDFEIEWSAELLGYWFDMKGDSECENITETNNIKMIDIPQLRIQEILLGTKDTEYTDVDDTLLLNDDENQEVAAAQEQEELKKVQEMKERRKNQQSDVVDDVPEDENKDDTSDTVDSTDAAEESETDTHEEIQNEDDADSEEIALEDKEAFSDDTRVLIGKDTYGQNIYWGYNNFDLANRHVLITGMSGQGKTYAIQCMLYEAAKLKASSVIMDYSGGFAKSKLEKPFKDKLDDTIYQRYIYSDGIPVNPFKRNQIKVGDNFMPEKIVGVAGRLADIFVQVYGFGGQQRSAIYNAIKNGIEKYGDEMNFEYLKMELEDLNSTHSKSVLGKIQPFLDEITFNVSEGFEWGQILYSEKPIIYIFQLDGFNNNTKVIATEIMLWDLYYYSTMHGDKDKPFVVVLDEAQHLSIKENTPSEVILREGRKYGWSAWFATQSVKMLSESEIANLMQAPFRMNFKPTDAEVSYIAKQLSSSNPGDWLDRLQKLQKGQSIIVGAQTDQTGDKILPKPVTTRISSFEDRK